MSVGEKLVLSGVRENNLRDLSLEIPHDRLVVVTGVSGSGKSTLAFDTIYAEGGRRYIETFSPYTRQFLDRLHQPELDTMAGVRPALALEQRNRTTSSRSTVGTVTEINDYLKVLWPALSELFCPACGERVKRDSAMSAARESMASAEAIDARLAAVCFAVPFQRETSAGSVQATLNAEGFLRYFDPSCGEILPLEELAALPENGEVIVVVERIRLPKEQKTAAQEAGAALAQAFHFGRGQARVYLLDDNRHLLKEEIFSEALRCDRCSTTFPKLSPAHFTFNSPLGACPRCNGFGKTLEIDPTLCIPDSTVTIRDGAVAVWTTPSTTKLFRALKNFCSVRGIDMDRPWRELSEEEKKQILTGKPKVKGFPGILPWFDHLLSKRHKIHVRVFLSHYRREHLCAECHGTRLRPDALCYRLNGKTIADVWQLSLSSLLRFFQALNPADYLLGAAKEMALLALDEVRSRLHYMVEIGLPYLTLDRQTKTLSGGESQRVNLTSILGSRLVNMTLVLDEPTIGLHPRDTGRLIETLQRLRDRGNSVITVEHDPMVIRSADEVLDLGPESGHRGGHLVYQGPVAGLEESADSLTGQYLSGKLRISEDTRKVKRLLSAGSLVIRGARAHNLKNIDVEIPLNCLVAVTGVSGSGKSTLVRDCLYAAAQRRELAEPVVDSVEGLDLLSEVVLVDQSPVGKTPRANPGTYTGAWELVRECLASTESAAELGLSRSSFSFNVDGGRCPECNGAGYHRIEMQFLADVFVECEACKGTRFKEEVLSVRYGGKNVRDFLAMTLEEVYEFFEARDDEARREKLLGLIRPLLDLGLGYLRIGQPLSELSGGEAQRLKLASYLTSADKKSCLFLFDEPTTGLHPHNVRSLLAVFRSLIDRGHSVLCIEHNLDLIGAADWMIDLGPEGGDGGGSVVISGRPGDLAGSKKALRASETVRQLAKKEECDRNVAPTIRGKIDGGCDIPVAHPSIEITGARHHNLKNISLNIPHGKLTVVTGVSGSGKSSLAFDILFHEGQRRYIDCLSPYARQYLTQVARPEVDRVDSLPPTIAISQKTAPPQGVSTIATVTEVYQFLRLLFCKVGAQHCPEHDLPITGFSPEEISANIIREFEGERISLFAPVISGRKGFYADLFERALRADITEARIDGKIVRLTSGMRLERHKLHWISLLTGSLKCTKANAELLAAGVRQALLLGSGAVEVLVQGKNSEPSIFSTDRVCPKCHRGFRELDPQDFSFRSARGVCNRCQGTGRIESVSKRGASEVSCPDCGGSRIGPLGRHVFINEKRIHDFTLLPAKELLSGMRSLELPSRLDPVVRPILRELKRRLEVICDVGLDYLSLDRDASTISGGEAQRLRLARALGSPLSGVCYVLDEPTIGLHPCDHGRLMKMLFALCELGNTVIVVEHDEETIVQAEHIVDIGPVGGARGGHLVAEGSVEDIIASAESVTGRELRRRRCLQEKPADVRVQEKSAGKAIEIVGATANNLQSVTASFPIGKLTVVCGVSGAGKSSLVHGTLFPALIEELEEKWDGPKTWKRLKGASACDRLVEIDQSPVGRTSSSTPASYLGIFDDIRKIYALLPEARARGWTASHFSFNSGKGKCSLCRGKGVIQIPMSFLPDATSLCEQCGGLRYDDSTSSVLYQGLSVGELLQKTMSEAKEILANHSAIRRTLSVVDDLGVGYLTLGQPTHTLSGGEVQRLKIARELGSRESENTVYILDEPTIGLHMADVEKLQTVLRRLLDRGNTIVIIEHDLDIIRSADHLIELGPGPAERGGKIIFSGTPRELMSTKLSTPTRDALLRSQAPTQGPAEGGELRESAIREVFLE